MDNLILNPYFERCLGGHLGKWALMAWCQQKLYGINCPGTYVMSVKNKQNSSVNFLVRAEFLTARLSARPTARLW